MEIVIHGTKKGRKIFTPNEIGGLLDVTPDSPKIKAIGENAYAIRFINNNIIFSKYKIIKDILGEKRIGFMGFSLFLSNKEKLSGEHIIALLDRVSEEYCTRYIIDNNWNQVTEDWDFVKSLSREYESKLSTVSIEDSENIQSGVLDEAFVYFYNDTELQKYFNQPYQEEYEPFRQIFFLSNKLKDKPENPINALRNSGKDLTGVIDLENPFYKLRDFTGFGNNGTLIIIKKSDGTILKKGSKVYKNDILKVIYSKQYYFHEPIEGTLNDDNIQEYLKIRSENKIDVERNFNSFKPVEKTIEFEIVKKDGTEIFNPIITCKSGHQPPKEIKNKKVTFIGEQLNEKWEVSVRDNDYEGQISILPEEKNTEKIILTRKKHVKIEVQDEEGEKIIYEYKVFCQNHRDSNKTLSAIDFIDDEIKKTWNIHIYGNTDYQDSKSLKFCPETDEIEIIFNLKEKTIKNPNNGKKTISDRSANKDQKEEIPFLKKTKFIVLSIVAVLMLSIGIWGLIHFIIKPKPNQKLISSVQINNYLESDNLILDTLKFYQVNWEKQNPQNRTKDKGFLSSLLSNNENSNISYETENWTQISDSINSAIYKRKLINNKDFEELKKIHFNKQEYFEKIIHDIKKNKYAILKEKLGNISGLSLVEIKSKIEEILNEPDSEKGSVNSTVNEGPKTSPKETEPKQSPGSVTNISGDKKENKGPEKTEVNSTGTGTSDKKTKIDKNKNSANPSSDISSEIKKYIKGDEITFNKLEEFKSKTVDSKIKESITIALKLWELDGTDAKAKREYLKQIEDNRFLSGSKLNLFVKNNKTKDLKTWNRTKSLKEISNENN